jgi:hypothetical protein
MWNMAKVGAQRAAELTGRSKSTIQRAMNSGKLSFEVDANNRRQIDVSELDRAFGLLPQESAKPAPTAVEAELEKTVQMLETERLKMQIKMLEEKLDHVTEKADDLKDQRDNWQKQAQQVLLTSQYSQKQAEELKAQLAARDERARMRRDQMLQAQRETAAQRVVRALRSDNENRSGENRSDSKPRLAASKPEAVAAKVEKEANDDAFFRAETPRIQTLWKKIRGQQDESNEKPATVVAKPAAAADKPKAA